MTTEDAADDYAPDETYDSHDDIDLLDLSVVATRHGEDLTGYVYAGVTEVFVFRGKRGDFPAGIGDFAGITARRFAERLRDVLGGAESDG